MLVSNPDPACQIYPYEVLAVTHRVKVKLPRDVDRTRLEVSPQSCFSKSVHHEEDSNRPSWSQMNLYPHLSLGGQGPAGVWVQELLSGDFRLAGFPEEVVM